MNTVAQASVFNGLDWCIVLAFVVAMTAVYSELYRVYRTLHDAFGTKSWQGNLADVMKRLMDIRERARV